MTTPSKKVKPIKKDSIGTVKHGTVSGTLKMIMTVTINPGDSAAQIESDLVDVLRTLLTRNSQK